MLAFLSALLSVMLSLALTMARRALALGRRAGAKTLLEHATDTGAGFVLVVPPIVIGAGWFLLLRHAGDVFAIAPVMVVTVNAVMAMPFALRAVRPAYDAASERHERLCAQLGISGWARLRLVDWPSLRRPLATAFAFAMALSLGDLGVIALFGSDSVQTLPYLLLGAHGQLPHRGRRRPGAVAWPGLPGTGAGRGLAGKGKGPQCLTGRWAGRAFAVRLDKVSFSYGEASLAFDVAFAAAEITAIMGPSGSGKSTLLNLVAGFETPESGRVLIGGADVGAAPPAARPVSMVFQENNLFAHLSVEQNVGLGRSPSLRLTEADRADIAGALARTGLAGKEKRLPRELSGGERQRVALARVLVRDRPVLSARRALRFARTRPCATICSIWSPACMPNAA